MSRSTHKSALQDSEQLTSAPSPVLSALSSPVLLSWTVRTVRLVWLARMPPPSSWALLLGPPADWLLSQYPLYFCSPQAPCVFGASDLVSDNEVPFVSMSRPHGDLPLTLRPPHLQTVMMKFPFRFFHPVLL
jgi:hypothetical protein